jgi:hypothetical protein
MIEIQFRPRYPMKDYEKKKKLSISVNYLAEMQTLKCDHNSQLSSSSLKLHLLVYEFISQLISADKFNLHFTSFPVKERIPTQIRRC